MQYETDAYARRIVAKAVANPEGMVVLDDTVFYPVGGGQPGDTGVLELADGRRIRIVDSRRAPWDPRMILHVPEAPVDIEMGADVIAEIDWQRRHLHMRMHTCLHLLCAVVDAPVTGCSIGTDRGRLDFDLPEPTIDRDGVTERLTQLIGRCIPVTTRTVIAEELHSVPELVRSRSVVPPMYDGQVRVVDIVGVDLQACGGTHVAHTGEIGVVRCAKIEKKSRHNRRVVIEFN
ncbi:alanyl-tRNA editing protein [Pseudothauera rhizosphaerae]|uniref:Alanine--tRNA ligase n=1 Tax=Pseudothauera rhizosphaerae TaxID=2565932 RepID=A0A4S4AU96_9RHOO|nr:alanyl-tRNA editing protein [Pseudothauera rhizosphaerae]THF63519.1 alanyl-tRNA editing protein [Pseudothauera rhizosphaerae]